MIGDLSIRSGDRIPWRPAVLCLAAGLLAGMGVEVAKLERWSEALDPRFIGANLNVIGAALLTWCSTFIGYRPAPGTGYRPDVRGADGGEDT